MKRLLVLLIAVGIAIGVSAQASAQINIGDTTGYFGIVIDGKTRDIELTRVDPKDNLESDLKHMQYVGVHFSPAFFAKNWPQYELNGLTARELDGHKVILPIWHNVDRDDVLAYSPTLADKIALSSRQLSIKKIAEALGEELNSE